MLTYWARLPEELDWSGIFEFGLVLAPGDVCRLSLEVVPAMAVITMIKTTTPAAIEQPTNQGFLVFFVSFISSCFIAVCWSLTYFSGVCIGTICCWDGQGNNTSQYGQLIIVPWIGVRQLGQLYWNCALQFQQYGWPILFWALHLLHLNDCCIYFRPTNLLNMISYMSKKCI